MTAAPQFLVALSIAIMEIAVVYLYWYREPLKRKYTYLYYGLTGLVLTCGVVLLFTAPIQSLVAFSIALVFAVLYRYREPLKREHPLVYHGLYYGSTGLVGAFVLLPILFIIYLLIYPLADSLGVPLPFLVALSMALLGLAVVYLYRYRKPLRREYPYIYDGLIGLLGGIVLLSLLTFVVIFVVFLQPAGHSPPTAGTAVSQDTGMVQIAIVDTGRVDSAELIAPDGTKSTMMKKDELFNPGNVIRLRSNKEVISYLNDPENSITVLTTSGTKTVENVSELPSEYQKAPDGLVNPDADIGNYANVSVATAACLIDHTGIEMGGRKIPANVSIPCNTPVLAQNDSVKVGTSVKPTSGPNAGKTLTSPILLRKGEYTVVGAVDGTENVVRSFVVDDETAQR